MLPGAGTSAPALAIKFILVPPRRPWPVSAGQYSLSRRPATHREPGSEIAGDAFAFPIAIARGFRAGRPALLDLGLVGRRFGFAPGRCFGQGPLGCRAQCTFFWVIVYHIAGALLAPHIRQVGAAFACFRNFRSKEPFVNHLKTFTLLAAMTALFMGVGLLIGGPAGMGIAFVIAAAMNLFAYWNSGDMVLRHYNAQLASPQSPDPRVRAYVEDTQAMARQAGMPMPKIYVIDQAQPNAFATGRDPANAAVAATIGLLDMLSRAEIRAVMAHELAHVQHRDTLTMTVTATLAGAIGMLANFAMFFQPRDENGHTNPLAGLAMMILAPIAAAVVQMAISRSREYEADALGAALCGDPAALASALAKIERMAHSVPIHEAERNPATAHVFIINPLSGQGADNLFSTHPSTANRIARLMALAGHRNDARTALPEISPQRQRSPWG